MICTLVSWDKSASKWVVELAGGQKARLAAANLMPEFSEAADVAVSPDKLEDADVAVVTAPALSPDTVEALAPATAAAVTASATALVTETVATLETKTQPGNGNDGN